MSEFFLQNKDEEFKQLTLSELASLVRGSAIRTFFIFEPERSASYSKAVSRDHLILELSEGLYLEIEPSEVKNKLRIIVSPKKELYINGKIPHQTPIKFQMMSDGEIPTAKLIEERLYFFRQLYALVFLIDSERSQHASRMLEGNPQTDIEEKLLQEEERLFITAACAGSFWLTVTTKSKAAFKSLSNLVPLFCDEGRQALLANIRSNARLKELDVAKKETELFFTRANCILELMNKIDKIKDPRARERIREATLQNMNGLGLQTPCPPTSTAPEAKQFDKLDNILASDSSTSSLPGPKNEIPALPAPDDKKKEP